MSDYGELLDENTVRFERLLPGPIERVWRYLTESELRAQWLCSGDVDADVGGVVEMHFHNLSLSGEGDIPRPEKYRDQPEKISFLGRVTRFEPPHILEHTWEFGEESSEVCYELSAQGKQVKLVLIHRKLESAATVRDVSGGWHTHLNVFHDVLEGKPRRPFYMMQSRYESEYAERLGDSLT